MKEEEEEEDDDDEEEEEERREEGRNGPRCSRARLRHRWSPRCGRRVIPPLLANLPCRYRSIFEAAADEDDLLPGSAESSRA